MDPSTDEANDLEQQRLRLYREVFLKVLQNHYWDAIHDGIIGRKSSLSRILLDSTNSALDKCHLGLFDWDVLESRVLSQGGKMSAVISKLGGIWPCSKFFLSEAAMRDQDE